ncbi:MAG: hypothetical protein LBG96_16760 [Tannerella sp.]|jgi:hypothetical protein|nr:hypothetical protein [Tannerella sp.]
MSCTTCKKAIPGKSNEERSKIRLLARKIAEIDRKTQVILEHEGIISITCEECWIRGGRIGTVLEYVIA